MEVSNKPWQTALDVMIGLAHLGNHGFVAQIFVPMDDFGRLMDDHPKAIVAYSWNVLGSLVGVWLFVL